GSRPISRSRYPKASFGLPFLLIAGGAGAPAPPLREEAGAVTLPMTACPARAGCGPGGEIGRHCGLKIRRLPAKGRAGSTPARGTRRFAMSDYNAPFEIHVHGQIQLRGDVNFQQLQDALKPLWTYAGARSLADGAESAYEDEP